MAAGFGGGFYEAIELVVRATGQADVDGLTAAYERFRTAAKELDAEFQASASGSAKATAGMKAAAESSYDVGSSYDVLERQIGRATTALEKKSAAAKWMASQTANLNQLLGDMAQHEATAERATVKLADAQAKVGSGMAAASHGSGMQAYKWLLLGNAIQDVQYGFAAIVNNIPGLVMGFGGGPGLAGVIGIAAVAMQQLLQHLGDIRTMFGQELPEPLVQSVKSLQERLKTLEDKPVKTRVDYSDIDIAKRKLAELTEAEAAYDRLKTGKSKAAQESGRVVSEAITEFGGGDDHETSVDRLAGVATGLTRPGDSVKTKELEKKLAQAESLLSQATDPDAIAGLTAAAGRHSTDLEASRGQDKGSHEKAIRDRIGRASLGYETDRKWLEDLIRANPRSFAAQGAQPGLLSGVAEGSRRRIEAKEQGKIDHDLAGEQYEAEDKAQKRKEAARKLAGGIDGDQDKTETAQTNALRSEDAAARRDRSKLISDQARRFKPGMDEELSKVMLDHQRKGKTAEQSAAALRPQVAKRLEGFGVGTLNRDEIANQIVGEISGKVSNQVQERMGQSGGTAPAAADSLLGDRANKESNRIRRGEHQAQTEGKQAQAQMFGAEFQRRTGANDARSMDAGNRIQALVGKGEDAERAMTMVFSEMMAAAQRVDAGLNRQMGMARQAAVGLRAVGQNARRGGQRMGSVLPDFGGPQ